jgi:hypothetical protein
MNKSGKAQTWTLSGMPSWMTADPEYGQLSALSNQTVTFTISSAAPIGKHEQTVYLTGSDGIKTPLTLNITIKADEPEWSVIAGNYENSMNVIGRLRILDVPSEDTDDMVGVFIDTFVVLTMTALIVISTIYVGDGPLAHATGETYSELLASCGLQKTNLVQLAFASVSNTTVGNVFVAICLVFFALSTILSWNFFGKLNVQYLFKNKKAALLIYAIVATAFIFLGSLLSNDLVWELTDFFNYLMVLPNAIALIALGSLVADSAKEGEAIWKSAKDNKN